MNDNTTPAPIGGADWEIAEAARKLSTALGVEGAQAEALRIALSDHATAVGSKSTAMIAGLFGPLMQSIEATRGEVASLARQLQEARNVDLDWRVQFQTQLDARLDRYGVELDEVVTDLRAFKAESRRDRAELRAIVDQLPAAEQLKVIRDVQQQIRQIKIQLLLTILSVGIIVLIFVVALAIGGRS